MPRIYSAPLNFSISMGGTDAPNVRDSSKYTYYETSDTSFTLSFTGSNLSYNSIYVLAEGIDSIGFLGANSIDRRTGTIFNSKKGIILEGSDHSANSQSLTVTKSSGVTDIKIYQIIVMKFLVDLTDSSNRSITRFDTTRQVRNAYIQEDLYGTRSLQVGHLPDAKRSISYQIWESANNLTAARNKLSEFYKLQAENPNITVWDLEETNALSFESVFPAFWVPGAFSETIEATQAISYNFTIEEQ